MALTGQWPGQWLRPPRTLLLALFFVTLMAVSALAWFGSSLLDQERVVEAQRAQERQEQAADRVAADAREALAETGERLSYWLLNPPSAGKPIEGVLLIARGNAISAIPQNRLLYQPALEGGPVEAPAEAFAEGEAVEFQEGQMARAFEWYRHLADSPDPAVKAGALLRAARVLDKLQRDKEARVFWGRLATVTDARVAGAPADLVARMALGEREKLQQDLLAGKWALSRGQFEFYSGEDASNVPGEAAPLSEAVSDAWADLSRDTSARGEKAVWVDGTSYLLIWHGTPERRAILAARPEAVFRQIVQRQDVTSALADAEGRLLLGKRGGIAHATVRTPSETRLPWTLFITAAPSIAEAGMAARQRFLVMVTAIMVAVLLTGVYFIARAIRTEAAVSRMQSDFVSAVSHEFRSPLTSMRQLSEMLALGRVPGDERRQTYYETLIRETVRLQRLVESLLSFGRMEEGVRRFRFEETDAVKLMAGVAAEFAPQIQGAGRQIEIAHSEDDYAVSADPEALTVALRNLVDNALKYAPDCPVIWMECGVEKDRVAISVRDHGPGIPRAERKAIFRKFVRGSAAAAANVKGSGVGLAMVRHIVAVHRGEIRVSSETGAGSTFTILLPRGAKPI